MCNEYKSGKKSKGNTEQENEITDNELLSLEKDYLQEINRIMYERYKRELEIENNLITQASHMQTAFSFITASVFMVAPIICQYRGNLSLFSIMVEFSIISFFIMVSLVMATVSFGRMKHYENGDCDKLLQFFIKEKCMEKNKVRMVSSIKQYKDLQLRLAKNNEKRIKYLRLSIMFFYVDIVAIIICFVYSLFKIIGG